MHDDDDDDGGGRGGELQWGSGIFHIYKVMDL